MRNRYAKLFALAKELGIDKDTLSAGAAQWSGIPSLRSLKQNELLDYELKLEYMKKVNFNERREEIWNGMKLSPEVSCDQGDYLIDLIANIFKNISQFRAWLRHYKKIDSEQLLDQHSTSEVIKALSEMRERGYKT
ncbi:MAG: hypothetical protein ACE5I1_31845 [bacterium]